ncbi:hypothetical protein [Amycolatopsis sp. CFH S0078]|uniref:hypothetical protein n=1 Tax=Amycolatopsis sp. CFH S0078 TaxID=1644108 RepID=UPI00106E004D|nr:hypothetical protein [Amycolatopsis sp. CFH S0078]
MPTELQEALTAAASVTPLIQKQIDPLLLEYQRRYAPLLRAIPSKQWGSTQYFFNRRTNRPDAGGVVDGGARPIGNSTYEQAVFNIRLFQAVGSVTGFAQTVTRDLVGDLRQLEIDGTMQSMLWSVENSFVWGNDGATAAGLYPICTGLDYQVANFSGGSGSNNFVNSLEFVSNVGVGTTFALKYLDEVIDLVETNAGMPVGSDWMFVMSPRMASAVGQVLTNQQRFQAPTVEIAAGLNVPSYRDVPIVKSSFLSPRSTSMGTVTPSTATTGGTLAAATYRYSVSAVVARFGETLASAEVTQATTGATSTVSLAFTTPTNFPDGLSPIMYKVYRSTGVAGSPVFIGCVDAFDTTGTATTTIVDTGTALLTNNAGATGTAQAAAYQGVGLGGVNGSMYARLGGTFNSNPVEDIYLVPRSADFMVRPYTRDCQTIPLAPTVSAPDTLPFALVTDTTLAIRGPKYVGRAHGLVSSI